MVAPACPCSCPALAPRAPHAMPSLTVAPSASRPAQELFELRKKVKTRQQVKPHLFTHTKHRIGQLQTLLSQRAA